MEFDKLIQVTIGLLSSFDGYEQFCHVILDNDLSFSISDFVSYDKLIRFRHDFVHACICADRGWSFGEETVERILEAGSFDALDEIKGSAVGKFILRQTPDLAVIDNDQIVFFDVAVSSSIRSRFKAKKSNYSELIRVLKAHDIEATFHPVILSLDGQDVLDTGKAISKFATKPIQHVLSRINNFLVEFHDTKMGAEFAHLYRKHEGTLSLMECPEVSLEIEPFKFYKEDHWRRSHILKSDDEFLDGLSWWFVKNTSDLPCRVPYQEAWKKLLISWQSKYLKCLEVNGGEAVKATSELLFDHTSMVCFQSSMQLKDFANIKFSEQSTSLYHSLLISLQEGIKSVTDDEWQNPRNCGIDKTAKFNVFSRSILLKDFVRRNLYELGVRGPFRKRVMKKDPCKLTERQRILRDQAFIESRKRKNFSLSPIDMESSKLVEKLLDMLSNRNENHIWTPAPLMGSINFERWKSTHAGATSLKIINEVLSLNWGHHMMCLQLIMREIARSINRLHKVRRDRFTLTKVPELDVFVIIYPGGVLRSEANPAYYQLLYQKKSTSGFEEYCPEEMNVGSSWVLSEIRSVDCFRLESYCVGFDRILMAVISHFESTTWPYDKFHEYLQISDFGAFESLMLIEGKLTTATSLSASRYILMNCLSVNRDPAHCLEKLESPIRSRLHVYGIRRIMLFTRAMDLLPVENFSKLKRIISTDDDGELYNMGVDVEVCVPPIFSRFEVGQIPLRMAICEIYLHMTYHKDRANPTHDERRILEKILKCQYQYDDTNLGDEDYGVSDQSDLSYAIDILEGNAKNYAYSARSVNIGSKLQRRSLAHRSSELDPYHQLNDHNSFNFNFTELSQFKASVPLSAQFNGIKCQPPQISEVEGHGLKGFSNKRSHVIMTLLDLFQKTTMNMDGAPDFINNIYKLYPLFRHVYCQLFKKNQITGVREIHILDIVSRLFVRLRENISRVICHNDRREMLTTGAEKFSRIKNDVRQFVRSCPEGFIPNIYHMSEDMTTWAQQFQIPSFNQLLMPHSQEYPTIHSWSRFILNKFLSKKIELPKYLMNELLKRYDESILPSDDVLSRLRKHIRHLKNKGLNYGIITNRIGMWMGILHYTSSHYHLALISLIEEIFNRALTKTFGKEILAEIRHNSYVSSDDRYRVLVVYSKDDSPASKTRTRRILTLYEEISIGVTRIFNVKLSSKSATGPLVGEFNSVFFTYETYLSATIKFAIQCCAMHNTDSTEDYIHHAFNSTRSAFENGLSIVGCAVAHTLNAERFYWIFQTGHNQTNSLYSRFGDIWESLPYQLGVYPLYAPTLMVMTNPEIHNYMSLNKSFQMDDSNIINAYSNVYTLSSGLSIDYRDETLSNTTLPGTIRIKILTHLPKKLKLYRRRAQTDKMLILEYLSASPLLQLSKSKNLADERIKMQLLLESPAAEDAIRGKRKLLYYGRVGAYASAKSFYLGRKEARAKTSGKSYGELVEIMIGTKPRRKIMNDDLTLYFPNLMTLKILEEFYWEPQGNITKILKPKTMTYRTLKVSEDFIEISMPLVRLLEICWMKDELRDDEEGKFHRSISTIKSIYAWFDSQSMIATMQNLGIQLSDVRGQQRMIKHLLSRFSKDGIRSMKCFIHGPSSGSLPATISNLYRHNYAPSTSITLERDPIETQKSFKEVSPALMVANIFYFITKVNFKSLMMELENIIIYGRPAMIFIQEAIFNEHLNPQLTVSSKLILSTIILLSDEPSDVKRKALLTAEVPFHTWILKQTYDLTKDDWSGPFDLFISYKSYNYRVQGEKHATHIRYYKNSSIESKDLWIIYKYARDLIKLEVPPQSQPGNYKLIDNGHAGLLIPSKEGNINIDAMTIPPNESHRMLDIDNARPTDYEVSQNNARFELSYKGIKIMTSRPTFTPINDEQINKKIQYAGKNETIKWLVDRNPFRGNLSLIQLKRTLTTTIIMSTNLDFDESELWFYKRLKTTTYEELAEFKANAPPNIQDYFRKQSDDEEHYPLPMSNIPEATTAEIPPQEQDDPSSETTTKPPEETDIYNEILEINDLEIDWGIQLDTDFTEELPEIQEDFVASLMPRLTRKQELAITTALSFCNRTHLITHLYMLHLLGWEKIKTRESLQIITAMIIDHPSILSIHKEAQESQMIIAMVKILFRYATTMDQRLTQDFITASKFFPQQLHEDYQKYFRRNNTPFFE